MLDIALHNSRQHRQFQHAGGSLVLARTASGHDLWTTIDKAQADRADALIEIVLQDDGVALTMSGCEAECRCGRNCGLIGNCQLPIPATFTIGDTRFEIADARAGQATSRRPLQKLHSDELRATGSASASGGTLSKAGPSPATLSRWFAALGTLNHWNNSLQELYVQAARCAVESIGLDGATVLRRRDDEWEIAASHLPHPELGIHCDLAVLDELLAAPQTLFHGSADVGPHESRNDVDEPAIVVTPLRNSAGELVGAIYGYRSIRAGNARRGIRYLEANLIELLAGAVSESIARMEREAEVDRRRILRERAFAACQNQHSRRMTSEQREVTLLFADLRGFTRLSASLEMEQVYELLGHVMDCLTAAVMDHDGLVLDYYGDGLAAMWNAPAEQADHPELACRAALKMLETLPDVAADWADIIQGELRLGVGVHTGMAQVGNAGSSRRTKYGPRGANVHLASRVEAATKELGIPLVVSRATAERLSNRLTRRRICRARMPGVQTPIDLYSIHSRTSDACVSATWQAYDDALRHFEQGRLNVAADMLATIVPTVVEVPSRFLAEHIERVLGRQQSRRSTDGKSPRSCGVISLNSK